MCEVSGEVELDKLIRALHMLANPTRLKMLALIAVKPRHAYELSKLLNLSYPLTHIHLRAMERAGLIEGSYIEEARVKRVYQLKNVHLVINPEL